jgi:hypothetical protein
MRSVCFKCVLFIVLRTESAHSLSLSRKLSAMIMTGLGVSEILEAVKNKLSNKGLQFPYSSVPWANHHLSHSGPHSTNCHIRQASICRGCFLELIRLYAVHFV